MILWRTVDNYPQIMIKYLPYPFHCKTYFELGKSLFQKFKMNDRNGSNQISAIHFLTDYGLIESNSSFNCYFSETDKKGIS